MGTYYAAQGGSRILNASRADQSGSDNNPVTNWDKANDFILAVNINSAGKDTAAAAYKLRWRVSGGAFADVASTGAIKFGSTNLVNGNAVTVGEKVCDVQGGDTFQDGWEVEGTANSGSIDLADEYESELQFSLSPADAADGTTYEFELWDVTNGSSKGTCGVTLTIASATPNAYTLDMETGVFTQTGNSVQTLAKRILALGTGIFLLAGSSAELKVPLKNYTLDAGTGVFTAGEYNYPNLIDNATFDSDVSGWNQWANTTISWSETGIGGRTNVMAINANNTSNVAWADNTLSLVEGKRYRLRYKYYIPSAQGVNQLEIRTYGTRYEILRTSDTTLDAWTDVDFEFVAFENVSALVFRMYHSGSNTGIVAGDDVYMDDVYLEEVGTRFAVTPIVALNTEDAYGFGTDTTPTINFTGTDHESDTLRYNIQIATDSGFSNIIQDKVSGTDDGFELRIYTSDFSSTEGMYEAGGTGLANNDSIGGEDDCYRFACSAVNEGHSAQILTHYTLNRKYKTTSKVYIPSTNTYVNRVRNYTGYEEDGTSQFAETLDAWNNITWTGIPRTGDRIRWVCYDDSAYTFLGSLTDYIYLKNIITDNIDFFPSASQIGFTSQSALSDGTYYYRVRAIDPRGEYIYGQWSETRSFTVGTIARVLDIGVGTFSLTGNSVYLKRAALINGGTGVFSLTGNSTQLLADRLFNLNTGIYSETGNSIALLAARKAYLNSAEFNLTGNSVDLLRGILLNGGTGVYNQIGNAINFYTARKLYAGSAQYELTGNSINFGKLNVYSMDIGAGTFTLLGNAVDLLKQIKLNAGTGIYTLTGNSAQILAQRKMYQNRAEFVLEGLPVTFSTLGLDNVVMECALGTFTLSQLDARLIVDHVLKGDKSTYTLTGNAVEFSHDFKLTTTLGQFIVTGNSAGLTVLSARKLLAELGSYDLEGFTTEFSLDRIVYPNLGQFVLSGLSVQLLRGVLMLTVKGTYNLTGNSILLRRSRGLSAQLGKYLLSGKSVQLSAYKYPSMQAVLGSYLLTGNSIRFVAPTRVYRWDGTEWVYLKIF